jgi:isoleucyl-tRNA synthetase
MVVISPEEVCTTLESTKQLLLELTNVKTVEYSQKTSGLDTTKNWATASSDDIQVLLDIHRDEKLLGEGLMRDLARRVQALRKEIGYAPTDVLEAVNISGLEDESAKLLQPFLHEMKDLVRAKNVRLFKDRLELKADWHDSQLDNKKVHIAICDSP